MSVATAKKIKKIKRNSVVPSIVFFIIALAIGASMIALGFMLFYGYLMEVKYAETDVPLKYIANYIINGAENGRSYDDLVEEVQKGMDAPTAILITDSNGEEIASYGDIDVDVSYPIFDIEAELDDSDDEMNIQLYNSLKDVDSTAVVPGVILFDINAFKDALFSKLAANENLEFSQFNSMPVYEYGFWRGKKIDDAGTRIYVNFKQQLMMGDLLLVVIMVVFFVIVLLGFVTIQFIGTISNLISQRFLVKKLITDTATGGNNFLAYETAAVRNLTSYMKRKKEFAIVNLSLLKFQSYCSLYGIEEGDKLLKKVYYAILHGLRRGEVIGSVAKGEFALLLNVPEGQDGSNQVMDRVNALIQEVPQQVAGNRNAKETKYTSLGFDAGIYIVPTGDTPEHLKNRKRKTLDVEQLYVKAGIAKMATNEDKHVAVYNHEMWEKQMWEQKVEDTMQVALERQEFQVYIQPKYNPVTEELAGGEALVRWISPTEGFISPGKFIPIFEKTGFVTYLDDYMISHTAQLQAKWLAEGKKLVPISVNVSRAHFAQPDLAEHIRDLVDQYQLPHKYIEIELTESAFFDDKQALLRTVRKLQEYGFEVSMDDFGSGYSSLNSLKDLPLNVLKLDAEFFRGEDFDTRGEIVVSEAIALAKQLNMRIVAEGVEKKEQVEFLASQDCDMIQGYYFAKPMPAGEYESRMKNAAQEGAEGSSSNDINDSSEAMPEESQNAASNDSSNATLNDSSDATLNDSSSATSGNE